MKDLEIREENRKGVSLDDAQNKAHQIIKKIQYQYADIKQAEVNVLYKWIDLGQILQELQKIEGCSQNDLTKLTGISKGCVSNYINLYSDPRVANLLRNTAHHGEQHLENITQKKLVKATKLNDDDFNKFAETGVIPSVQKASRESKEEEVIDIEIDISIEEQIEDKKAQIEQLLVEVAELEKQLPSNEVNLIETSSLSESEQMDKPSESDTSTPVASNINYSPHFNLLWSTYVTPVPTHKGNKLKASKAYEKAVDILSHEEIMNALSLYMSDEFAFGRRPANLSTFLNGIITNTKYRDSYIDKRYDKVVRRQEGAYGKNKTAMDYYEADLTLQGTLSREKLIGRTDELDFNMSIVHKDEWSIGFIDNHPREDWVPFLGDGYVAFQIKKSKNGDFKRNVLFTIEELRNNLYVHYHGYVWTEKFEDHYKQINAKIKASLPAPDKKDSNIIEVEEIEAEKKDRFTAEELFE